MKNLMLAALVTVVLGSASGASAQDAEPTAEQIRTAAEAFDQGRAAYKSGAYVQAAEAFELADHNAPDATALEQALRARDKAGQLDRAATLAALALERHPDKSSLAELARSVIERADDQLHKVRVTCDAPCSLAIDNKIVHGARSTDRVIYLEPGTRSVSAGWQEGGSAAEEVTAAAGGASKVEFLDPGPPTSSQPEGELGSSGPDEYGIGADRKAQAKGGGWSPAVFWTGVGLTVVAGGVTAWSGVDTVNDPGVDRVRDECRGLGEDCELYQQGRDKQARTNVLAGVTAGLGVVTILVGAFATDWSGGKAATVGDDRAARRRSKGFRAAGVELEPWLTLDRGATLGASGRF